MHKIEPVAAAIPVRSEAEVNLSFPIEMEQWIEGNSWLLKILQLSKERGFIGRSTDVHGVIRHSIGYAVVINYLFGPDTGMTRIIDELNNSNRASTKLSGTRNMTLSEGASIDQESGSAVDRQGSYQNKSDGYISENERHKCKIIDVGTGGGIPGIPVACYLAREYGGMQFTLLDANLKRTSFLEYVLSSNERQTKDVATRVSVINTRAELYGRELSYRGSFQVAIARSLAKPATTVELCSPLLQPGGYLVVSLDPHSTTSSLWPDKGLERFGMIKIGEVTVEEYRYLAVTQVSACPDVYPRRVGIPSKRPVW